MEHMRERRVRYNEKMMEADAFFGEFAGLDDGVYAEGAIGKNTKG